MAPIRMERSGQRQLSLPRIDLLGGGNNLGTVFTIDADGSSYRVLHVFQGICCGKSDGSFPVSG